MTREYPGRRLAQALRAQGLNQSQIAGRIGVASPTISRLIAGKQALTQEMATKLAAQTGVRVCWLLTGALPVYPDHDKRAAVEEAFAAGWNANEHTKPTSVRLAPRRNPALQLAPQQISGHDTGQIL